MAIVKMKRLRVIAMAACREELLGQLQRLGCVEIREPETAGEDWSGLLERESSRLAEAKGALAEVNTALAAMRRYGQVKDGLFVKRRLVTEKEFLGGGLEAQAKTVTQDVGERLRTLSGIQTEMSRLQARRAGLLPWQDLDLPLEAEGTEHVLSRLGTCPAGTDVGALRLELEALPAELLEISADKQQRYLLLLCHRAAEEPVMEVLRAHGFSAAAFPGVTGTAAADLKQTDRQLEELQRRREEAEAAIAESARERDTLRTYADRLTAETARESAAERLLTDGTIVFFEGWAPAERMADVSALLERLGCAWEAADPAPEEYPEVPVKLKNNCLTRPLNMVTEMYSLPAYDNVDPNPLMAPFFILFYGVMMADMGYGLLMMLASVFVLRTYRPKGTMQHFFGLLGLCGISTFVMGALTGGFFGDFLTQLAQLIHPESTFALPALFTPLDDTLMILVGAMCLGFVQILTGMVISVVGKLKRGQFLDAFWEEITWWVVFAGIALAVLWVTNLVLYAGIGLVVAGPVINGKGFGKITGIFGSLYNHVTGYFGDILSYSRLMALMLSGSVIAQVFNTLGAIPGNVVVFFIVSMAGNALNFALNLLGCYVHDLRLQCLEFFKTFYQDGGKPFRPLAVDTKYVDIQKD